jgi:demethylmenaquinone methyltransferase/2-methoxy-6-polyprenyl-1,4-benzoquinol methylase
MPAQNSYAQQLELFESLRKPLMLEVVAWLDLPQGSHGLDAGCGVGLHLKPLLEAVSPGGRVTGVDLSHDLLDRARELMAENNQGDSIDLQQADLNHLPFEPESFDWLWSVDCAGYMPGDKDALIKELVRVLKPGGYLALTAYSSQQLLPGYPGLEARLNASKTGQLPFRPGDAPGHHFMRLSERFSQAGLVDIRAKSFLADFQAPLEPSAREALLALMDMRWGPAKAEVSPGDWDLFSRLSKPGSPECILEQPGYYGFFTYTAITGRKPS